MRGVSVSKAKRIAAGAMCLALLLAVLLSALFLAAEADHDCAGEDCPVCALMQQCGSVLRRFVGAPAIRCCAAAAAALCLCAAVLPAVTPVQETLVSSGIRMNN